MLALFHSVVPEVTLTADNTHIRLGDVVALTCHVARAKPVHITYTWTNMDTETRFPTNCDTLTFTAVSMANMGTYKCEVMNAAGTGMDNITIALRGKLLDA